MCVKTMNYTDDWCYELYETRTPYDLDPGSRGVLLEGCTDIAGGRYFKGHYAETFGADASTALEFVWTEPGDGVWGTGETWMQPIDCNGGRAERWEHGQQPDGLTCAAPEPAELCQ